MNGNMIPQEWKVNFKMSHKVHFTFCVKSYENTVRVKPRVNSQLSPTEILENLFLTF